MFQRIKIFLLLVLGFSPLMVAAPAMATPDSGKDIQCGISQAAGNACSAPNPSGDLGSTIKTILNILSAVAGVLAVLMIMVAGLRFVTSAGSEAGVKSAKGMLIYAVIGLAIVAVAQIIVHFVIKTVSS